MNNRSKFWVGSMLALLCISMLAVATEFEPPDSKVNPQSQDIEIADPVWSGSNKDIQYVIHHGDNSRPDVYIVSDDPLDDLRPRVAIAQSGDAWVAWWRDDATDRVVVRKRNFSDGSWDAERVLSDAAENSRNPVIVHDGIRAWVAYEFEEIGLKKIGVMIVIDEPDPIGVHDELATTGNDGPIDLNVYSEQGQLWVAWTDNDTEVGWVEYDHQAEVWGLPAYESYAADSVEDARDRIRAAALGD